MSVVNDYLSREAEAKALNERLEAMKNDPAVQKELAFKERVVALMEAYDKSVDDVLFLLNPKAVYQASGKTRKRKPRCMKVYRNPHTDEVIKTRGGNHNGLKAWKAEYGADTVEGWVEQVIDQAA